MKKYELVENDRQGELYRIKALRDFADVKKDSLGGYIECEKNLSHAGNCWVYDQALVFSDAVVSEDAQVRDEAQVYDKFKIQGSAIIKDEAEAYGDSIMTSGVLEFDDCIRTESEMESDCTWEGHCDEDGHCPECGALSDEDGYCSRYIFD